MEFRIFGFGFFRGGATKKNLVQSRARAKGFDTTGRQAAATGAGWGNRERVPGGTRPAAGPEPIRVSASDWPSRPMESKTAVRAFGFGGYVTRTTSGLGPEGKELAMTLYSS
jgi:hypothetical protein